MMKTSLWEVTSAMEEDVLLLMDSQDLHTRHGLAFMQVCGGILTLKEAKHESLFLARWSTCVEYMYFGYGGI